MKPQSRPVRKLLIASTALFALSVPVASALEPAALVPRGGFVSLDTHRLYVDCRGSGSPRVLIDYGIAGAAIEWRAVQTALAADTTVCVYDRAGYGWSDPGPSPRTAAQAATELGELAAAAGWTDPLLLVGHSFGGFDVRYFAATRPAAVAGLVLLESSLPAAGLSGAAPGSYAGARNPLDAAVLGEDAGAEPADPDFAVARYLNSRRKAVFTQMDELGNFARSAEQVAGAGELPPVPLLVVTRDPAHGLPDAAAEEAWQRGQRALAAGSPNGEWWPAPRSGHEIHKDRPDLVVAAVRSVLARVRRQASP